MNYPFRTIQRLAVSALVLSVAAMAQEGTNNTGKNTEHHSKMSKMAFWRHHNANKGAKQNQSKPEQTKAGQTKTAPTKTEPSKLAQTKPAAPKKTAVNTQVKAVSAKRPVSKTEEKHSATKTVSSASKTTGKASSAQPKKLPQKSTTAQNTQDSQKDSSKN